MTEYVNDLAAEAWLSDKIAEGNPHAKMIRYHMDAMRDANATAYATGALDELRRHPPQATATEAREADRETLGRIVRKVWVDYCIETNHIYKPDHIDSWEQLDEWAKEVDRRIGETVAAYVRNATAPSQAAGGEAGRLGHSPLEALVAWAASLVDVTFYAYDLMVSECIFCQGQAKLSKNIKHADSCLHLWAVAQLAASPRPEAETDTVPYEVFERTFKERDALKEQVTYFIQKYQDEKESHEATRHEARERIDLERDNASLLREQLTVASEALATARNNTLREAVPVVCGYCNDNEPDFEGDAWVHKYPELHYEVPCFATRLRELLREPAAPTPKQEA